MHHFSTKFSFTGVLAACCTALGLAACGGGGGGTSATTTPGAVTPAPVVNAGVSYTAFTEDRISSGTLVLDTANGFASDGINYNFVATSNGGCTLSSNPRDPSTPACSPLAGGEAFLLCDGTATGYFDTVLFKPSVMEIDFAELRGRTLTAVTCGNPGVRSTSGSFVFQQNGVTILKDSAGNTSTRGADSLSAITGPQGEQFFNLRNRLVARKIVQGSKTTFFMMELYENFGVGGVTRKPSIFMLEVNT